MYCFYRQFSLSPFYAVKRHYSVKKGDFNSLRKSIGCKLEKSGMECAYLIYNVVALKVNKLIYKDFWMNVQVIKRRL